MKTSKPKLSILVATLGQRETRFKRLLDVLTPQLTDQTELVAYWNNFERPLYEIRQALIESAKGKYVCFVDDDDLVPKYYVEEILKAAKSDPDYIGWRMQLYMGDTPAKPTFHSIKYPDWSEDEHGWYRNVSHLNPIKKTIAQKVPWEVPEGTPEDSPWAARVFQYIKSEEYIDRPMYFYYPSAEDSQWRGGRDIHRRLRPLIRRRYFRWHPESQRYHGHADY